MRLSDQHISTILQRAIGKGYFSLDNNSAIIFYNLSAIEDRIDEFIRSFSSKAIHAIAIKANPLISVLKRIKNKGVGLEAASLPELYLAQRIGVKSNQIVFNSPAKTYQEIQYALKLGCHLNANSLQELERINEILKNGILKNGSIGLRINPQVGVGTISSTSVAGEYSKFGVPLLEEKESIIQSFKRYPWLDGLHIHIGSQGCPIELLIQGAQSLTSLVSIIEANVNRNHTTPIVKYINMGGGLPAQYGRNTDSTSLNQYSIALHSACPLIFEPDRILITEFGRHIHANAGWVCSRVEYVKKGLQVDTILVHIGADMFLRKCYCPEDWHHEIIVLNSAGELKGDSIRRFYNIAGPLCFAGDFIEMNLQLPEVTEGDYLVIMDAGAYTLSMWSRYNSRQIPAVIGYNETNGSFLKLRARETLEDVYSFWS